MKNIINTKNKKINKKRLLNLIYGILGIVFFAFLYYLILRFTTYSLKCKFKEVTGLSCGLCGITRICYNILNFNFNVIYLNYGLFLAIPFILFVLVLYIYAYLYEAKIDVNFERYMGIIFTFYLIAWTIIRNILHI